MRRRPAARLRDQSINRLIPNMLTVLALCAGLTSIRFGLQERWELAVAAIVIAGILDGLDGRIARMLDGASKFGAELDSLSDFISFGVAPALLLYYWTMYAAGGFGWAVSLLFAVCCALRLARFNTKLDNADLPAWTSRFFSGVPAPAAAGLSLLPMVASFQFGAGFFDLPVVAGFVLLSVALLTLWGRRLDALAIGDETAHTLGVRPDRLRLQLLVVVALCVGVVVSASGSIGFVGLVVPHLARRAVGGTHVRAVAVAALMGAILLIWADVLARTLFAPQEIPIGIITSLVGAPFLLVLIRRLHATSA
jgi:CDP-diacylglycerol--serine O-phosphatidyltransferase